MKPTTLIISIFSFLAILSCSSLEKNSSNRAPKVTENNLLLNDIWQLYSIGNSKYENTAQKHPQLEFNISQNKFYGNDGCNQIQGSLSKLSNSELQFGEMFGTKMRCSNMNFTNKYHSALLKTRYYSIKNLQLILLDSEKNTLMIFRKTD